MCPHTFVIQLLPERKGAQNKSEGDGCSFGERREGVSFSEVRLSSSLSRTPAAMLDLFPGFSFLGAKNRMQSSAVGSLTGADCGADNLHQGSGKTESTAGSPYNTVFKIKVQILPL